ncbi:MAG: TRAP transporter substrate-binding protein [Desulfobacterales bacterium]|nr:TRAP transporter substrate-binding protein [Desulfobacterales bacterium]
MMKALQKTVGLFMVILLAGWGTAVSASAAEGIITIVIPSHITPKYKDLFPSVKKFADRVNELGKGKVKVELRHSESLFKNKEIIPALMNGACEMAFQTSLITANIWPEIGGLSLPFLYKNETDCHRKWTHGNPVFNMVNKEIGRKYGVRVLTGGVVKSLNIFTREKSVEIPDDLKGLKIRSVGKTDAEFFKACGADLTSLSSSKLREALKLGTLDGFITYPDTVMARKLTENLSCFTDMEPIFSIFGYQLYVLNKTFDSWPKEVQDIILKAANEYDKEILSGSMEHYRKNVRPVLEKKMKIIKPGPENMKKFVSISKSSYDKWSSTVDKAFADEFIKMSKAP